MMNSLRLRLWKTAIAATPLPTLIRGRPSEYWQNHWRKKLPDNLFERYAEGTPLKKWFAKQVVDLAPASVLELGCNVGANLREIHALDPAIRSYGIELNDSAIAWGRQHALPSSAKVINGSMADAETLMADSGPVDIVFTSAAAMHCDDDIFAAAKGASLKIARKAIVHMEFNAWCPADLHNGRLWHRSFLSDRWIRDYAGEYEGHARVDRIETRGIPLGVNIMDDIGRVMVSDVTGMVIVYLKPV